MNVSEKIIDLVDFAKTLTKKQKVVFSCEGNLYSPKNVEREAQNSKKWKPNGLWYSVGNDWINYLVDGCGLDKNDKLKFPNWFSTRLTWYTHVYELVLNYDKILKINTLGKTRFIYRKI